MLWIIFMALSYQQKSTVYFWGQYLLKNGIIALKSLSWQMKDGTPEWQIL